MTMRFLIVQKIGISINHINVIPDLFTITHVHVMAAILVVIIVLAPMVGSAILKIDLRELTCQYPSHIKPGAK